jgi:hypothetical protein
MKIEYGNHCFGDVVRIDGFDIVNSVENKELDEESIKAQDKVLEELKSIKDKLSIYDWRTIVEIITHNDKSFIYDLEESSLDSCDQCGNYNEFNIFKK